MKQNIYEIQAELLELYELIEESGGEVTDEQYEAFLVTKENFDNKVKAYCHIIKEGEAKIAYANSEIKRIEAFARPYTNLNAKLSGIILEAIKQFGDKDPKKDIWRYEVDTFKLSTRSSVSTEILDAEEIDDKFKKITFKDISMSDKVKILDLLGLSEENAKITIDIPKTLIKDAILAGETVEGAKLQTNYSLNLLNVPQIHYLHDIVGLLNLY